MDADIIVIGAGPVGMLSALLADKAGLSVILLEKSCERQPNSRAIGITPPSLEILRNVSLDLKFVDLGVPVSRSEVIGEMLSMGRADFSCFKSDYKFILAIPQNITESVLEEALKKTANIRFLRGHEAKSFSYDSSILNVKGETAAGDYFQFSSRFALACDGGKSASRESLKIRFIGFPYKETFLMGDFDDNSGWKDEARLYLTSRGSVESFPLPGERRRYVLRTPYFIKENTSDFLEKEIPERCGVDIGKVCKYWESAFGVGRYLAEYFYKEKVLLCGDAAHIMSPIGGQNMNTGFADAELAVWLIKKTLDGDITTERSAALYNRFRKKAAVSAAWRAGFLMKVGTSGGMIFSIVRSFGGYIIFHSLLKRVFIPMAGMLNIPFRNLNSPDFQPILRGSLPRVFRRGPITFFR